MWGTEWPRFEVIKQDTERSLPQMVGSVHATDPEHALLVARHVFVRRPSAYALFVAPAEAFFHVTQEALKDPKALKGPWGKKRPTGSSPRRATAGAWSTGTWWAASWRKAQGRR